MTHLLRRLACCWAWILVITLPLSRVSPSLAQHNVTIVPNASELNYTPFLCQTFSNNDTEQCEEAWRVIDNNGTFLVSTNGPVLGSIIPQMFFRFRASSFYMSTSPFANATTNITISNNGTVLAAVFNSSVGMVSILNLVESQLSTVAITFIPVALPTRLDIGNITLTVTGNPSTSAFLPTMTLPPSASLPIFGSATPTPTPTPVKAASNHHTLVIEAVSFTLGLSFGLTALAVVGYLCWRRKRRRRPPTDSDSERSQSMHSRPAEQTRYITAGSQWTSRALNPSVRKQNENQKTWFS